MRTAILLVAGTLAGGCGSPYDYAASWENNTCPEDIPGDYIEGMSLALDKIEGSGFDLRAWGKRKWTTNTVAKTVSIGNEEKWNSGERHAAASWHELVHVRQYKSGYTSLGGIDDWYWAIEVQATRQNILTEIAFGRDVDGEFLDRKIEVSADHYGWDAAQTSDAHHLLRDALDGC